MTPEKIIVGPEILAECLGVTLRALPQMAQDNKIVKTGRGRYDLVVSVRQYIDALKTRHAKEDASIQEAQRQLTVKKVHLAQIEIEKQEGRLIEKVTVEKDAFEAGRAVRDALLLIPDRLIELEPGQRETVRGEIVKALEALQGVNI